MAEKIAPTKISEEEFAKLCGGIFEDREIIWKHNPIGTREEILLWMLVSVLVSYLSLEEVETPCFNGRPDAQTYHDAVLFILNGRKEPDFDEKVHLQELTAE